MLKALVKWLLISLLVISALAAILLGLGYLLNENEKNTKALVAQIEQEKQANKQTLPKPVVSQSPTHLKTEAHNKQLETALAQLNKIERVKSLIVDNLVCKDVSQCKFVDTGQVDLGCVIAVNSIGKSLLLKEQFGQRMIECEERISDLSLTCHHNICSIE